MRPDRDDGYDNTHLSTPEITVPERQLASERGNALADTSQSAAASESVGGVVRKARSIVGDRQRRTSFIDFEDDLNSTLGAVPKGVRERLLECAIEGSLTERAETRRRWGHSNLHAEAFGIFEVSSKRSECRKKTEVVQRTGPEIAGHTANALDPFSEQRLGAVERWRERLITSLGDDPELEVEGSQDLSGLVMEFTPEPIPLSLVLVHHAGLKRLQFFGARLEIPMQFLIGQRCTDLLTEGKQKSIVEHGEGITRLADDHERAEHSLVAQDGKRRGVSVHLTAACTESTFSGSARNVRNSLSPHTLGALVGGLGSALERP